MRFGELAELRRGDIDLRTNRVRIRCGVVRVDGRFIVGPPKSDAGIRDVAIPPHLVPLVKEGSPGMSVDHPGLGSWGRRRVIGPQESITRARAAWAEWNP